ncbi:MAG: hypothetical protein H7Y04_00920 [Verrucomicrobia bacterium]|nr:hypothetical protein [Cytophagales bacterium]
MRILIFCFLLACFQGFTQTKLKKVQLSKTISIALPEDFTPMTDDEIARKYFTFRKPAASFSDPQRLADFSFNENRTPWRKEDIALLQKFYKASYQQLYTKIDFIQEKIVVINKRSFVLFEFVAEVKDEETESMNFGKVTRTYEFIQYTVENEKVQIYHFSCPYQLMKNWQNVAASFMQSVKIK